MNARIWKLAAALCLVASAVGCKQDSGHDPASGTPTGPTLTLTASDTSVIANGSNTVTLAVTDSGGSGPIAFTTTRGTFSGGGTTTQLAGATGTVTLVTCDASTVGTCAGTATVTATGPGGTDSVSITFGSLASVCPSNCSADPGCAGSTCTLSTGTGTCSATTPSTCTAAPACVKNPANATTETSCSDGIDNDCSGDIDCADSACDGQQCGASPLQQCQSGACTDLASGLAVTVTPARVRLPANGTATTTVVVALKSGQDPVPNLGVTLSIAPAGFGTLSAATGTTGTDGTVAFTFTAPASAGVAVITASATLVPAVRASASITMPRLGSIQIPDPYAVHPVMGVKSSGWNEFGGVLVQVLDDQGQPYPDGLVVHFEHSQLGGSTFGPPLGTCAGTTTPAPCVAYDAATTSPADKPDTEGMASAPLFSGTVAGTLVVSATTTAGGVTRTATLPNVAVVGAKANLANFSIQCSPRNVPALAETDCSTSWVDAPFTCVALLKDRFDNLLGTSTQVIFASEAAAVGQVAWTPAYTPTTQGAGQKDLGSATQIFQTLGAGLPFDVTPFDGTGGTPIETSVDHELDGCGVRTHNPRDGVVTIVAIADGEEAFFDSNGNGQYDTDEPFVDQGEPFVDQDDDGVYTPGEWFLDVDGSGDYTSPNGAWDAFAKIWTQTVVVYTGPAVTLDDGAGALLGTRWVSGAFSDACTPTAAAAPFAVNAKVTGPPAIPPTSVGRVVVASDLNLNRLNAGAKYGVAVVAPGKVVATYHGLQQYADDLGMFYRYWPCDQNDVCASQCRATGADAPCVMTPSISAFSCGIAAGVTITGGDTADGTNFVDWVVDVPWKVYLGEKVMHSVVTTSGTNN